MFSTEAGRSTWLRFWLFSKHQLGTLVTPVVRLRSKVVQLGKLPPYWNMEKSYLTVFPDTMR